MFDYYLPSLVTHVHQTVGFNQRINPTLLSERNYLYEDDILFWNVIYITP